MFDNIKAWQTVDQLYNQFRNCVKDTDWLGAYFNLQLAIFSCKHFMLYHSHFDNEKHYLLIENDNKEEQMTPPNVMKYLLTLLPKYKSLVKQFQSHFGCPDKNDDDENSLVCEDKPIDIKKTVDKNNGKDVILFNNVIGNEEPIQSIKTTIIQPYIMPKLYPTLSRGILFYGPAGTGKTLLAKATAFELFIRQRDVLNVLFYAPTAEKLKGKYLGETEKKITTMFQCASKNACETETKTKKDTLAILFIDEIDAIARSRDGGDDPSGVNASATNTLLQMMDGVSSFPNVIVISATNLPWNIDSAILRRFSSKILVPLPNEKDVLKLIKFLIVQWITKVLYHSDNKNNPTFNPTKCSTFNWDQAFNNLRWIHNVKETELKAVAQMCNIGNYAPRDLKNICQQVFIAQGSHSRNNGGFHKIAFLNTKKHKIDETELNEEHTKDHRIGGEDAEDVADENKMYLPIQLCKLLEGKYLSSESYRLLQKTNAKQILENTPPVYPSNVNFPLEIIYNNSHLKHFSIIKNLSQPLHKLAISIPELLDIYYSEKDEKGDIEFMLHKKFRVTMNTQEEVAPVFLYGKIKSTQIDTIMDSEVWFHLSKNRTPISLSITKELISNYVTKMYIYHQNHTFSIIIKGTNTTVDTTNSNRSIIINAFIDGQINPYDSTASSPLRSSDKIAKYLVHNSNVASQLSKHKIIIHYTPTDDNLQTNILPKCCNLTLDVTKFQDKMAHFPTGNTEKTIQDLNNYKETGKIPVPENA